MKKDDLVSTAKPTRAKIEGCCEHLSAVLDAFHARKDGNGLRVVKLMTRAEMDSGMTMENAREGLSIVAGKVRASVAFCPFCGKAVGQPEKFNEQPR